jgi:D-inositol-3-phosphate glycosyltransferase
MEGMACGRPVVATDTGDVRWLIEDGHTGFVVPNGDTEEFASRVEQILADPALQIRMGLAGRRKAELEFGLDRLAVETLQAYRSAGWKGARA